MRAMPRISCPATTAVATVTALAPAPAAAAAAAFVGADGGGLEEPSRATRRPGSRAARATRAAASATA